MNGRRLPWCRRGHGSRAASTCHVRSLRAVDQLTFSVAPGQVFGFLGPNGAGKTTTIKILTGQIRPSEGQAWVAGKDVVQERQALKPLIGVVFDSQNLYDLV